jgi:O-antigen/teichoic acid export membrane protein
MTTSNVVFPVITFPYAARILAPEGIGNVQFALSFAQYFAIVAAFGIPVYGVKEIARANSSRKSLNKAFTELMIIAVVTSLLGLLIYILPVIFIERLNTNKELFFIGGFIIGIGALDTDWFFGGLQKFGIIAVRTFLVKIVAIAYLFLFVHEKDDLDHYMIFMVIGFTGNYVFNLINLKRFVSFDFSRIDLRKHFRQLLFIFLTSLSATIYTKLDGFIIGLLSSDFELGLFTSGIKLAKVCIPIVIALGVVLIPRISEAYETNNEQLECELISKSSSFIVFLAVPLAFLLVFNSREFILVFSGAEFVAASKSLMVMASLPITIGFGHLLAYQILVIHHKGNGLVWAAVSGLITFTFLNLILTPTYGALGASVSIALTESIVSIIYALFVPTYLLKQISLKNILYALISSAMCTPLFILFNKNIDNMFIELFVSSSTFLVAYIVIQGALFSNLFVLDGYQLLKKRLFNVN